MKIAHRRMYVLVAIISCLTGLLTACISSLLPNKNSIQYVTERKTVKTTKQLCHINGGELLAAEDQDLLPNDMVDCLLPSSPRSLGLGGSGANTQILGSVYDYLYRPGIEKPGYGLYSYALLPVHSERAERFLQELFKTTSFVKLSGISRKNLNLLYLPTKADKLSSLLPKVEDGSPPSVAPFAMQFYDYSLAEALLGRLCASPSDVIRSVCNTDLSRGPYLATFSGPISILPSIPPPYLFVDLSGIHEGAFGEFVTAYKEQVKRADYSDAVRIDSFRLRVLNIMLTAADWVGHIESAMSSHVYMVTREELQFKTLGNEKR